MIFFKIWNALWLFLNQSFIFLILCSAEHCLKFNSLFLSQACSFNWVLIERGVRCYGQLNMKSVNTDVEKVLFLCTHIHFQVSENEFWLFSTSSWKDTIAKVIWSCKNLVIGLSSNKCLINMWNKTWNKTIKGFNDQILFVLCLESLLS